MPDHKLKKYFSVVNLLSDSAQFSLSHSQTE